MSEERRCDIVVPVYNAFDCLERCIESVLKNTDFNRCRLILIDDKSSDKRVLPLLRKYKKNNIKKIVLLENKKNMGFVKTVNKGMRYSDNDVLLLNSDTIVPKGWLDRMILCGKKSEEIATVTPFSNNLTPMKPLPERFRKKGFPDGYNFERMAKLVQECSMRKYPELPSAHGFCMYIKREALNKVGYFDEKAFGKGYGEENDFCFRCFDYGYKHVLCDDVFVFHEGAQSFLKDKKFHNDELTKMHPDIMKKVSQWYEKQDIKIITDNIELAIGMNEERVNVLVLIENCLVKEDRLEIDQLREKYNIHVLMAEQNSYILHSFFKVVDLDTAIYRRPVVVGCKEVDSLSFKKMVDEIKEVFGISFVIKHSELRNKKVLDEFLDNIRVRKTDFSRARVKMLECDLVKSVKGEGENILYENGIQKTWFGRCYDNLKNKVGKIMRLSSAVHQPK